jgi:Ca-activated chloride channel family protein
LQKDPDYRMPEPVNKQDTLKLGHEDEITEKESPADMRLDLARELEEKTSSAETPAAVSLDSIPLSEFREEHFKPVNVVFVLDVSASMGSNEKFDLLKFSLLQLSDLLRPQDRITLVTYASEAKVLLPASSGQDKETIRGEIKKLRASGQTAGTTGIKLGFKEAEKSFISDGSNLVIVITDGAFNKNNGDYLSIIEKYSEKGIVFSVVGIKNLPKDEINMREAAGKGKGAYVPVFKLTDARQNLIREIRRAAFKGV